MKRQGLDEIIRDAMNSIRPKKKTRSLKMRTPNFGDVANDPLSSIKRPRRPRFSGQGGGPRRTLRERTTKTRKTQYK